jgi:hypothetical protein
MSSLVRGVAIPILLSCLASPFASGQQAIRRSDREAQHLLGPVKAVYSLVTAQPTPDSPAQTVLASEETYSPEGWRLEFEQFDGEGKPVSRLSYHRDGARILEQESTLFAGPRTGRTVAKRNDPGMATEITTYNLDDTLRDRTVVQFTPDETHRTQYDATGQVTTDVAQHIVRTEKPERFESQTITDGNAISESKMTRIAEGSVSESSTTTAAGHSEQKIVRDRAGVRNVQVRPNGQTTAAAIDATGQTVTFTRPSVDGREIRSVQHFDAAHRLTAAEFYLGDTLRDREIARYENDDHGNWVKMVTEHPLANGERHAITTTVRTITYY